MKKTILMLIAIVFAINLSFAQKADKSTLSYKFKLYPAVKFDKNIKSYFVELDALSYVKSYPESDIVSGKYYVTVGGDRSVTNLNVRGMERVYVPDNALKVKVIARTGKNENDYIKMAKATLGNADMVKKISGALNVTAQVSVGDKLLKEYKYSFDSEPEQDYVLKLKSPTAPGKMEYTFKNNTAHASFLVDNAFTKIGKRLSRDLNNDFTESLNTVNLEFYTIKAKKFKYDDYNSAVESITSDLTAGKFDNIADFESKMMGFLGQVDYNDKKAQYNKKIAAKIYINALNAYLIGGNYDKVVELYESMKEKVENIPNGDAKTAKLAYDWAKYIKYNYKLNADRI